MAIRRVSDLPNIETINGDIKDTLFEVSHHNDSHVYKSYYITGPVLIDKIVKAVMSSPDLQSIIKRLDNHDTKLEQHDTTLADHKRRIEALENAIRGAASQTEVNDIINALNGIINALNSGQFIITENTTD